MAFIATVESDFRITEGKAETATLLFTGTSGTLEYEFFFLQNGSATETDIDSIYESGSSTIFSSGYVLPVEIDLSAPDDGRNEADETIDLYVKLEGAATFEDGTQIQTFEFTIRNSPITYGTPNADSFTGTSEADLYNGANGNDRIIGNGGNDELTGNSGNDFLSGGSGRDILEGGSGDDQLRGGTSADKLDGGEGYDIFIFGSSADSGPSESQRDIISGFRKGQDHIDLSIMDARPDQQGNQAFRLDGDFDIGQIKQVLNDDGVLVNVNLDNDSSAEMSILIEDRTSFLTSSDFIL